MVPKIGLLLLLLWGWYRRWDLCVDLQFLQFLINKPDSRGDNCSFVSGKPGHQSCLRFTYRDLNPSRAPARRRRISAYPMSRELHILTPEFQGERWMRPCKHCKQVKEPHGHRQKYDGTGRTEPRSQSPTPCIAPGGSCHMSRAWSWSREPDGEGGC